jgi:hypothetical protein
VKIESVEQEIRNLLSSGYYRIPRFQRPFSWTQENIQEFWDDVVRDNPLITSLGLWLCSKRVANDLGLLTVSSV